MYIDPVQLIDQTIDLLQTLAAHFEDETNMGLAGGAALSPEAKRCKEALITINVLIPKLRAARLLDKEPECRGRMDAQERLLGKEPECRGRMDAQERLLGNTWQQRMCLHCED